MEPLCEFCGLVTAVVYCKSDSARLCLHCDGCVHSANSLSRRHLRSLLCDKCNAQPATVRCIDEKMSLCQICDQWSHTNGNNGGHRTHALTCYEGCPSLSEFSRILSSLLDGPSSGVFDGGGSGSGGGGSNWESLGSSAVAINDQSTCVNNGNLERRDNNNESLFGVVAAGKLSGLDQSSCVKYEPAWMARSTLIPSNPNCIPQGNKDQAPFLPQDQSSLPKLQGNCSNFKDLTIQDSNDLCEGLNIEDVPLNFENADGIFSCQQQGQSRYQFEDGEMDCLLIEKNLAVTESNGPTENAVQASSSGQQDCVAFQSSCGSDSVMPGGMNGSANCLLMNPNCSRNINLRFPTGQVHSSMSLSLSSISRDSNNPEYQDCGLSPVFLAGEPWESTLEASSPQARDKAKMRYKEKKKTRTFGKQIRYASRKARADTRKRVKGRFVKAGEEYDYDPLTSRNF